MTWAKLGKYLAVTYIIFLVFSLIIITLSLVYYDEMQTQSSLLLLDWLYIIMLIYLLVAPIFYIILTPIICKLSPSLGMDGKQLFFQTLVAFLYMSAVGIVYVSFNSYDFLNIDCQTLTLSTKSFIFNVIDFLYKINSDVLLFILGVISILITVFVLIKNKRRPNYN